VVDGTGLENRRGATHREFESRPLRHRKITTFGRYFFVPTEKTSIWTPFRFIVLGVGCRYRATARTGSPGSACRGSTAK
jgi:hypothetical protein